MPHPRQHLEPYRVDKLFVSNSLELTKYRTMLGSIVTAFAHSANLSVVRSCSVACGLRPAGKWEMTRWPDNWQVTRWSRQFCLWFVKSGISSVKREIPVSVFLDAQATVTHLQQSTCVKRKGCEQNTLFKKNASSKGTYKFVIYIKKRKFYLHKIFNRYGFESCQHTGIRIEYTISSRSKIDDELILRSIN